MQMKFALLLADQGERLAADVVDKPVTLEGESRPIGRVDEAKLNDDGELEVTISVDDHWQFREMTEFSI